MVVACLICGAKYEEDPTVRAGMCPRCYKQARDEYFSEMAAEDNPELLTPKYNDMKWGQCTECGCATDGSAQHPCQCPPTKEPSNVQ